MFAGVEPGSLSSSRVSERSSPPSPKKRGMRTRGCGGPGGLNPDGAPGAPAPWPRNPGHEAIRGQGHALGANGQRTGESLSWSSLDSCTARCGRGICCVACRRSWSGKASVSAPPPGHRIPAWGVERGPCGHIPAQDPKNSTGRGEGTCGTLCTSSLLTGVRTEPDFPSFKWGWCHFALPYSQTTMSSQR